MRRAILAAVVLLAALGIALPRTPFGQRLLYGGPAPLPGKVPVPVPGTVPPSPALKIAFLGDSGAAESFSRVLALVRLERADAVVHLGDAAYEGETAGDFWGMIDRELGHGYPYFLAQGNHDLEQWRGHAEHAWAHLRQSGAVTDSTSLVDPRFALVFRGVSMLFVGESVADDDPRRIVDRYARDPHIWKVCAWHKNQTAMQLGGKGDWTGWGIYESCRQMGAFVVTGHEHSYHRTRTLRSTIEQTVDPTCADAKRVCVRPGAVPVFVSGLGGHSVRVQRRCLPATYPYGCNGEWAYAYTANQGAKFGALFVVFGDGDARRGRDYFKNVDGQVVDEFELVAE